MKTRIARLVLLCLAVPVSLLAGDSKIRGRVTGSSGDAIAGATVLLEDSRSGKEYKLQTKKDGSYYQRGVLPATYRITVSKAEYTPHIVEDVRVQAGLERVIDVTLRSIAERQAEAQRDQQGEAYVAGFDAFQEGDFEKALARADEAIAKNPADPKGYDMKAKALFRLRRYAEAIPLLEHELGLEGAAPDAKAVLATAHYNVGVGMAKQDRNDEAIASWQKAIEQGFNEPEIHKVLGQAYLARQDFPAAIASLEEYLRLSPSAADAQEIRTLVAEIQKLGAK